MRIKRARFSVRKGGRMCTKRAEEGENQQGDADRIGDERNRAIIRMGLLDEDIYMFGENSTIQQTICTHIYSWMLDESWNSCYSEGRE